MSARLGVLNNLRAGQKDSRVGEVLGWLSRHPEVAHRETSDDTSVPRALAELREGGVEVLVLNGGDGTVQLAITELMERSDWRPWLAPVCGGRTNVTAHDLGAARSPVRSLDRLLAALRADRIPERAVARPVLRIELPDDVRYGMVLGFGMLQRAVDLVHRSFPPGRAQGALGAGIVTGMLIVQAIRGELRGVISPDKLQLACNGVAEPPHEYLLAVATTLTHLFLRIDPFWGREPAPIRFTTIASEAEGLGRAAAGVLIGRPGRRVTPERGYRSQNLDELEVRLDSGLVIDGELLPPMPDRRVRVRAISDVPFLRA